jgi:hypothetical protein
MAFKLRSPAFGPGGEIPLKYTGAGADISPPAALDRPARRDQELHPHHGRGRGEDGRWRLIVVEGSAPGAVRGCYPSGRYGQRPVPSAVEEGRVWQ